MTIKLTRLNHVSFVVSDLEKTLNWFRDVFGLEAHVSADLVKDADMDTAFQLKDTDVRLALIQLDNTEIELLEYRYPVGKPVFDARNCDVGAFHFCFEVDDLAAAVEAIRKSGYEFSNVPTKVISEEYENQWYCHFRGPDNIQLQLYGPMNAE